VVVAGLGLIVAEIRKKGIRCDGVDWSAEMVKFAKLRRRIDLIQADGSVLQIADGAYATVIYATGVIDFMGDERAIKIKSPMIPPRKRIVRRRKLTMEFEKWVKLFVDRRFSHMRIFFGPYLFHAASPVDARAAATGITPIDTACEWSNYSTGSKLEPIRFPHTGDQSERDWARRQIGPSVPANIAFSSLNAFQPISLVFSRL
jgi:hypothetical protein